MPARLARRCRLESVRRWLRCRQLRRRSRTNRVTLNQVPMRGKRPCRTRNPEHRLQLLRAASEARRRLQARHPRSRLCRPMARNRIQHRFRTAMPRHLRLPRMLGPRGRRGREALCRKSDLCPATIRPIPIQPKPNRTLSLRQHRRWIRSRRYQLPRKSRWPQARRRRQPLLWQCRLRR